MSGLNTLPIEQSLLLTEVLDRLTIPAMVTLSNEIITNKAYQSAPLPFLSIEQQINTSKDNLWVASGYWQLLLSSSLIPDFLINLHDAEGRSRWISLKKCTMHYGDFLSGFEVTGMMTELDLLRQSEARLAGIFQEIAEPIFIVEASDNELKLAAVNPSFGKLFAVSDFAVSGYRLQDIPALAEIVPLLTAGCTQLRQSSKLVQFEAQMTLAGKQRFVLVRLAALTCGKSYPDVILGTIIDMTTAKNQREEIEVNKQKAEVFSKLKSSFLANLSHEIRTPLNGIMGFAQILTEELEADWSRGLVRRILASSHRLLATLNALIDLSRLEAENLIPETSKTNMTDLIAALVPVYTEEVQSKGLEFYTEISTDTLMIVTDKGLMKSIIDKLIDNAVKYTAKGKITLHLYARQGWMFLEVMDTGIGIDTKHLSAIFEEFWQVEAGMERSHEGLGIGLTLARKMLKLMGGEILVSSLPGKGSVFTIKYPLQ